MLRRTCAITLGVAFCVLILAAEGFAQSLTVLDVLNISKRLAALEAAVSRLEKTNAVQNQTIKALTANLTAAQATIATLQTDLATVPARVNDFGTLPLAIY